MKHLGKTAPFKGADGKPLPGSIAEVRYLRLGGVDQWVMIRGESVTNPALIVLSGGPGLSERGLLRRFNAPLEKRFTVVYWDQRGSGKSFDRRIPSASMTLEQFLADLDQLVDVVRARLGKEQVALFGHSWGSVLGLVYAARFPEKVSAYVGSGQVGDWPEAEAASYAYALQQAERLQKRKALKDLRAIGPPPYGAKSVFKERIWVQRLDRQLGLGMLWRSLRIFFRRPEASLLDLPNLYRGFRATMKAMWGDVSRLNLKELVPAVKMPVFFLLGRKDRWVPPETSLSYIEQLEAPAKQVVFFEQSGHEPFADEPDRFNQAMAELVRPALAS